MSVIPLNLAVEDELSAAVLRQLLLFTGRGYRVGATYGRSGFGYLRSTIGGWNRAARGVPFIVLTDLDHYPCAPDLIRDWLAEPRSPNLLLRVAVREVESWLLADGANLAQYLGVAARLLPSDPDALPDPKGSLIELANRSRSKEMRAQVAPRRGSTATQGPEYNSALSRFVQQYWDIPASQQNSPSLARTVTRLGVFKPIW